MKTLILAFLAAVGSCLAAAADPAIPQIIVTGTAVTEATPDQLKWRLTVTNRGPDVAPVAEAHTRLTATVVAFLKGQGMPDADIQTSGMRLSENLVFRSNSQVQEGYIATTEVAFTSKDLTKYRDLWMGLSKLEGVSIRGSAWDLSKRIEIQDSTRVSALKAAQAKAATMAAALNRRTGEPLTIEEIPMSNPPMPYRNFAMAAEAVDQDGGTPIAPGAIEVRVEVRVTFRLLPN